MFACLLSLKACLGPGLKRAPATVLFAFAKTNLLISSLFFSCHPRTLSLLLPPSFPHPGIFKIEDSAQVARLWGVRKNRPAMNYDKLSRSIRQYYKKGIIRKPDISQRLVYQFVHPV